jgi:predicted metalloprotease with PDZ domain
VEGKTIELRPNLWGNGATGTTAEVRAFDIGFDLTQSDKTKIIHGVKQDGNAWRAGVRDGQKWRATDMIWGDPTYLAEIEIEDGQQMRRVKYYPASAEVYLAPQYTAATERCDPGRLTSVPETR